MVELRKANPCDYIRFVISALLLLFSLLVTSYAIVTKQTSFYAEVPGWAALLLFIVALILLGIVEGLQIALVELKRQHPDSYKYSHPKAYHLGQVAAKGDNVERFLMGRQVSVVVLVFFAAKLTVIHADDSEKGSFLFPVPKWFQVAFLETGFLACIVVVILAQLMPQIVAAKYPVHFLQFVVMRPAYYMCIGLEMTGLTHICWCLSALMERVAGMTDDTEGMLTHNVTMNAQENESNNSACQTLDKLHTSLEAINIVSEKDQMTKDQFSRFSQMVDSINQSVSPDMLQVLRHYLDNHPEKFSQFPSVIGNKMYPAPQALAEHIRRDGHMVPKFLTDISDPEHVPPHIVACEMLAKNRALEDEVNFLRNKLAHA